MNVAVQLEKWARKFPQKAAIIFQDKSITYRQLRDNTFKLGAKFTQLGLKKGDCIAIYLPNSPEYIYSYLAVFSLGLIAVPLDFTLTEDELRSCLSHCQAAVLIAQTKEGVSLEDLIRALPFLKKIILPQELSGIFSKKSAALPRAKISAKDRSLIVYSSGLHRPPQGNCLELPAPGFRTKDNRLVLPDKPGFYPVMLPAVFPRRRPGLYSMSGGFWFDACSHGAFYSFGILEEHREIKPRDFFWSRPCTMYFYH